MTIGAMLEETANAIIKAMLKLMKEITNAMTLVFKISHDLLVERQ